jgi:eukaryotic-like serine/threonine-protein kinase
MKAAHPSVGTGTSLLTFLGAIDDRGKDPVYIVWHHQSWCPMACKIFDHPAKAQREAAVLNALAHPNIVRYLGMDGPKHLLMEFLDGSPLSRAVREQRKKRLSIANALRVGIHLGSALQHVHDRGFVHLDIKPSNIIVVHGRPILFDFGTARLGKGQRPRHPVGTDPYMAPEECLRERATAAADVFSLGVTLYELLTGELPFPEGTKRRPFSQLRHAPRSARCDRRDIPEPLDDLLLRCLAQDPSARPSLSELLPGLHGFVRSGPPMWPPGFSPDDGKRSLQFEP